jgi:protocatechuate 3,4-dioxygenase beta subunit
VSGLLLLTRPEAPVIHRHPTYQGRALPRPEAELVDQGLAFDIGTVLSRRQTLRWLGLGAASVGLVSGCGADEAASPTSTSTAGSTSGSAAAVSAGEIPDETAGPYPGDGSNGPNVLEQSGVVRGDIRTSFGGGGATAEGVPMTLELTISDLADGGTPFAGAAVYVWHCDRDGQYSLYASHLENENYLRGVQIADDTGKVSFTSIFPACYSGRWPHVHFEVYPDQSAITDAANAIATSQVALPEDVCDTVFAEAGYESSVANLGQVALDTDNVFGDDSAQSQLATVTGDVGSGYTVALAVGVDTRTTPAGGGAPPGGGGPGGPPPSSG